MKKIYLFSLLVASSLSYGQAFTATYGFDNFTTFTGSTDNVTPPPIVTGLTFGSFSAINPTAPTPYNSTSGSRFSFASQPIGATNGDDVNFTGSINTGIYYQVTVTPNASITYNLSDITFTMRRQATGNGIRSYAVRSSVDNYASNLSASLNPSNANLTVQSGNVFFWTLDANSINGDQLGSKITLGGASYTGLTTPVTFRFYGWNAEISVGPFTIDDVVISGSTETLSLQENTISGLKIYPNPSKDNLYITSDNNEVKQVEVSNLLGKVVVNATVTNTPVNISSLTSGMYVVKVIEAGKTATKKLLIE